MNHVRQISSLIDLYIAPSHYLRNRFTTDFGIPSEKVVYLDYGFHRSDLRVNREKMSVILFLDISAHISKQRVFNY